MKATTWEPWLQHYDQSLIMNYSNSCGFMRVLASDMWCEYVMNDDKVSMGLILVNVKDVQISL
jgi:hypothetical protein